MARARRLKGSASMAVAVVPHAEISQARHPSTSRASTSASSALVPSRTALSASTHSPPRPSPNPVPKLHPPTRDLFASLEGFEESVRNNIDRKELQQLTNRLISVMASVNARVQELEIEKEMNIHECD